jgi:hypothetical protein
MLISDLDYLESVPDDSVDALSGSAGVLVGVWGWAEGRFTRTWTNTRTFSWELPNGGSLDLGLGGVLAIAYTPPASS